MNISLKDNLLYVIEQTSKNEFQLEDRDGHLHKL